MEPTLYWQPVLAQLFGWQPWDMERVLVAHYVAACAAAKEAAG